MAIAFEQEAGVFQFFGHGGQHVIGLRHDKPTAFTHIDLGKAVDAADFAHLFAWLVDLWKAARDPRSDALGYFVDGCGDAVGLFEHLGAPGQVDEVINVCAGPPIDCLVVIARTIHPL